MNMIIIWLMTSLIASAFSQPWTSRFDYDYQPVPISSSHFSIPVQRRPIRMLASPRYRPDAIEDNHQLIEDPFYQPTSPNIPPIASASFFPQEPQSRDVQPRPSEANSVSDFMSRLATTIPEIAEKMAKITPSTLPLDKSKFNAGFYTFAPETTETREDKDFLGNVRKSGLGMFFVTDPKDTTNNNNLLTTQKSFVERNNQVANVVNSMPLPESLFSFNKLFSAFTSPSPSPSTPAPPVDSRTIYDMRQIKGTPILKDEDDSTEIIQKPDEFVAAAIPSTEAPNPAENLLGTILSGKSLDQVDWIGAIFNKNSIPGAGEQNPITQIFKGGLFGSGLDDDAKITKSQDQNFH